MIIDSKNWRNLLFDCANELKINLNKEQLEKFVIYAQELIQWNKTFNLTKITVPEEIAIKHFIDSLIVCLVLEDMNLSLLDVGSGAGFPGIPLSIVCPDLKISLMDSSRKRVNFQKHILRQLNIKSVQVFHKRFDLKNNISDTYDIIVSRAFTNINKFVQTGNCLLNKNGTIICMKGKGSLAELDSLRQDNMFSIEIKKYILPVINQSRYLVLIKNKTIITT